MNKHRQQVYSGLLVKMNTGIKLNSKQGRQEIKVWKRGTTLENVKIKVFFFNTHVYTQTTGILQNIGIHE